MSRIADLVWSVLPNIAHVVKRFPISVLLSGLMTLWIWRLVAFRQDFHEVTYALLAMFFTSVAMTLLAERRGWGLITGIVIGFAGCVVIGGVFYFSDLMQLTPVMFIVACLIGSSLLAYLGMPIDNRSYWFFNHCFWFNLVIGLIGGLLVAGLVALLIGAYSTLFDMHVSSRAYSYSFIAAMFFIAPMIWLSLIPTRFDEQVVEGEQVEFSSKITGLFVKYVFVPFFFLFVFLFHGLALKIGLDGTFPKGQIGLYGLALVIGCIGTYLMAFPTRNSAGPLVRLFSENWIWFLIVPLGLILAAHFIRINEYGMTPLRYYMTGLFVWAFVLIGYSVFVRVKGIDFDLRTILFLAMLVIGVSSFGPWGAEAVSLNWQKQRLVEELTERGVLEGGVIARILPDETVSDEAKSGRLKKSRAERDVNSLLQYFKTGKRDEALLGLLPAEQRNKVVLDEPAERAGLRRRRSSRKNPTLTAVRTALGMATYGYGGQEKRSHYTFSVMMPIDIPVPSKGDLIGQIYVNLPQKKDGVLLSKKVRIGSEDVQLVFAMKDGIFVVSEDGAEVARFPYQSFAEVAKFDQEARAVKPYSTVVQELKASADSKAVQNRIYLHTMSYNVKKESKVRDIDVRSSFDGSDFVMMSFGFYYFRAAE